MVSIIEYNIVGAECELNRKGLFEFGDYFAENSGEKYNSSCGICVISDEKNKSYARCKKHNLILFGSHEGAFVLSLQWLSLTVSNVGNDNDNNNDTNNSSRSYHISVDEEMTKEFQHTLRDRDTDLDIATYYRYNSFGYTKWKHYIILFGGLLEKKSSDSIFYFDLLKMTWHKSLKVL